MKLLFKVLGIQYPTNKQHLIILNFQNISIIKAKWNMLNSSLDWRNYNKVYLQTWQISVAQADKDNRKTTCYSYYRGIILYKKIKKKLATQIRQMQLLSKLLKGTCHNSGPHDVQIFYIFLKKNILYFSH